MTLELEAATSALVLIDLQQGILAQSLTPHPAAAVLAAGVELGRRFRAAGALIVAVNVGFSADGAERLRQPVDFSLPVPAGGVPPGWSDLDPAVAALGGLAVTKRQWGAFHATELDLQLRRRGIATIVLAGVSTSFGVETTAREAWQHGYAVVVAEDACSASGEGLHAFAIERILPRIARVRRTADIVLV